MGSPKNFTLAGGAMDAPNPETAKSDRSQPEVCRSKWTCSPCLIIWGVFFVVVVLQAILMPR